MLTSPRPQKIKILSTNNPENLRKMSQYISISNNAKSMNKN